MTVNVGRGKVRIREMRSLILNSRRRVEGGSLQKKASAEKNKKKLTGQICWRLKKYKI